MKNIKMINTMNSKQYVAAVPVRAESGERNAYPIFIRCLLETPMSLLRWAGWAFGSLAMLAIPALCSAQAAEIGEMTPAAALTNSTSQTQTSEIEDWNIHGQATYVWQKHPGFRAAYTGTNSLTPAKDFSYTLTETVFIGKRLWQDGEFYLDSEILQAKPFTGNLVGFGTVSNGEVTRSAGSDPKLYIPRLFLRQTWNSGGETQLVKSGANQLSGTVQANRFVLTLGKFSTLDIFDNNAYAKDPRTQFMNAANMASSAFDYASDSRGYGWGFAGEWYRDEWVLRFGRMTPPHEPNGFFSDYRILQHYGDQVEVERAHNLGGQPGKVRILAWRNKAHLSSFQDALNELRAHPGLDPQTILRMRLGERVKYGLGINVEQALTENAGVFLRAMAADGKSETHAFTEVDGSLAMGASIKGAYWGRAEDTLGIALMRNTISDDRRNFLEAGGISYFIGDGALRYRPETIFEGFYSLNVYKGAWLTGDYQRFANPAYNADRGPINVYSIRLHAEF